MPETRELLLVRHGQSTANARGVWQGQMEFPLSDEGRQQARAAGKALTGSGPAAPGTGNARFHVLYSSPLARAFETAEIIAQTAGFIGEITSVPGLMERHGGVLEGYAWDEQEARNPDFAGKFLSLPEEERWAFAGAETDEQVMNRFGTAIREIVDRHADGSRILVVTHGGTMRAFLRDRFGPDVLPDNQRAANASITRLRWGANGAGPELLELASTEHLADRDGPDITKVE